jgi:hypothetical protein
MNFSGERRCQKFDFGCQESRRRWKAP